MSEEKKYDVRVRTFVIAHPELGFEPTMGTLATKVVDQNDEFINFELAYVIQSPKDRAFDEDGGFVYNAIDKKNGHRIAIGRLKIDDIIRRSKYVNSFTVKRGEVSAFRQFTEFISKDINDKKQKALDASLKADVIRNSEKPKELNEQEFKKVKLEEIEALGPLLSFSWLPEVKSEYIK